MFLGILLAAILEQAWAVRLSFHTRMWRDPVSPSRLRGGFEPQRVSIQQMGGINPWARELRAGDPKCN